jgi:alkanesulfonate monooxygenase SsuD/methylene tetrahydromethanopterin reductase-like flavin-dependent oxidoreductase (luciferase family)
LKVGVHALGYVAPTRNQAIEEFYPGYLEGLTKAGRERGWGPVTRAHFDAEVSQSGALIVGGPDEVVEKIRFYDEALGGISRLTFQMDLAALPHATLMRAIELLGTRVAPALQTPSMAAA